MIRVLKIAAVAASASALLTGCSLLSTPDPVQMYRFGSVPGAGEPATPAAQVQVAMRRPEFDQAVRDDRILGVTGTEAAYIKGARWVSSADILFNDALESAFAAQSTRVRLVGPREMTRAPQALDIDVRTFEARYASPGATPVITIVARTRLLNTQDRSVMAERVFTVEQPASQNRVSAIVEAFDVATRDIHTQIVNWTDQNARDLPNPGR